MISVRHERPEDISSVRIINEQVFSQPVEADIVDKLQQTCFDTSCFMSFHPNSVKSFQKRRCTDGNRLFLRSTFSTASGAPTIIYYDMIVTLKL